MCKILLSHCLCILMAEDLPQFEGESIEPAKTFVKATCLTHLEHVGLSVCSLFVRTLATLNTTAHDLSEQLTCNSLAASLISLGGVFGKYYSHSKSWWWCRAYDDGYLAHMSGNHHPMLIAVLSELLKAKKPLENEGITESQVMKNMNEEDKFRAKAFAWAILKVCYSFGDGVQNPKIKNAFERKIEKHLEDRDAEQEEDKVTAEEQEQSILALAASLRSKARKYKSAVLNTQTDRLRDGAFSKDESIKVEIKKSSTRRIPRESETVGVKSSQGPSRSGHSSTIPLTSGRRRVNIEESDDSESDDEAERVKNMRRKAKKSKSIPVQDDLETSESEVNEDGNE